jgi:hypothetical protein
MSQQPAAASQPAIEPDEGQEGARAPVVWWIVGDRLGDNAQAETLVSELELPVARKYVKVQDRYARTKPRVRPTLHHLDLERSDALAAPWPDLVITIGRRLAMVALWIKRQSGGRTKIVYLGKPSGYFDACDLIIASAETLLPPMPNVMSITLPMLRVDEAEVARMAEQWRGRLADLPRPLIGILVGGPTNPYVFDSDLNERLLRLATDIVERDGGTPYVTTSPRTPRHTIELLRRELPAGARFFEWRRGADDNPYKALLGLGDGFIVTGDSISMLVEVAKLRRPLAILPLPTSWYGGLDQIRRRLARWLYRPGDGSALAAWRLRVVKLGHRLGLMPQTRDFTSLHEMLVDKRLAVYAGEELRESSGMLPDDYARVVARVMSLLQR